MIRFSAQGLPCRSDQPTVFLDQSQGQDRHDTRRQCRCSHHRRICSITSIRRAVYPLRRPPGHINARQGTDTEATYRQISITSNSPQEVTIHLLNNKCRLNSSHLSNCRLSSTLHNTLPRNNGSKGRQDLLKGITTNSTPSRRTS